MTSERGRNICPLHDLPVQLLYEISRNLDLKSQQKLFMSSRQLYSRWRLQTPAGHSLEWGLGTLAHFPSEIHDSFASEACLILESATKTSAKTKVRVQLSVSAQKAPHEPHYDVEFVRSSGASVGPLVLSRGQLLHRLVCNPAGWGPVIVFTSHPLTCHAFTCLAQHLFDELRQRFGYLRLTKAATTHTATSATEPFKDEFSVCHWRSGWYLYT